MAKLHGPDLDFIEESNTHGDKQSLKHAKGRFSKQQFAEHKMFGSKRNKLLVGKKFRKKGKDVGNKKPITARQEGNSKSSGVSPSMEQIDKMLSGLTKGSKKSMFKKSSD